MKDVYGAVVIGSGFGGAVSACRLAQAGVNVAILERGKRYPMGSFPRKFDDLSAGWTWSIGQGLFDVKPMLQMQVVQAAGWGGGSLIYANVHLRPIPDVFAQGWPDGYDRARLDPYYDLVGAMLGIRPITDSTSELPPKTKLMKLVADKLGRGNELCYPNIAVELDHPGEVRPNKFGVPQTGCNHCGECDIGCNDHAKNTLDLNYLALAEKNGADVATLAEVWKIAPLDDNGERAYRVFFRDHAAGGAQRSIVGRRVFVCAGAVNTTELLLRCRDEHKSLPALSDKLGAGYSGNGDFLAAAYETSVPFEPSSGPTITTGLVYDHGEGDDRVWLILQDGGFPKEVAAIAELLAPNAGWLSEAEGLLREDIERAIREAAKSVDATAERDARRTALFLAMGRDRANGRIELVPLTNTLRIVWDVPSNLPLYDAASRLVADLAGALGGKLELNPFWKRLHLPVSVHNLGGCIMASDPEDGVTSPIGEVFNYPGLYVMDGAILPSATGVNPSSTIAAVAERNVETIIRAITSEPGWTAPEWSITRAIHDPLSAIVVPRGGVKPLDAPALGFAFTETMKGFVMKGVVPGDGASTGGAPGSTAGDYVAAEKAAHLAGTIAQFTLTITVPDLDAFLVDKAHAGIANGTLRVDGFTPPEGASVAGGVFNLFVDTDSFYERKMLYLLPFVGADGKPYVLDGFKEVKDHGHFDVWGATSTLYSVVREGHTKTGPIVATGVLHIHLGDFMHQMTTFKVPGAQSEAQRLDALARFCKSFMGTLWDVFVQPRLE